MWKSSQPKTKGDYEPSFYLDSRFLNDQLHKLIKSGINEASQIQSERLLRDRNDRLPSKTPYPMNKSLINESNDVQSDDLPF